RRAPHLPPDRTTTLPADPRHAGGVHLPGRLERLSLAARRARRRRALHASRRAREPGRRARPGHGAHDGRRGPHRAPRPRALRGAATLLPRGHHGRRSEGVTRARVTTGAARRRSDVPAAARTWLAIAIAALVAARARGGEPVSVVDDFEHLEGWSATASEGAPVWIAQEPGKTGGGMRIDHRLGHTPGY